MQIHHRVECILQTARQTCRLHIDPMRFEPSYGVYIFHYEDIATAVLNIGLRHVNIRVPFKVVSNPLLILRFNTQVRLRHQQTLNLSEMRRQIALSERVRQEMSDANTRAHETQADTKF